MTLKQLTDLTVVQVSQALPQQVGDQQCCRKALCWVS
jgi:hypothetical protein